MSVFGINASARFTQDEIRHFSAAQMAQLAIHAPPVYSAKDADIVAFLQKKNITSLNYAERVMARAAATAVPQLRDRTIRPDQYTKDTATPVVYTKEKIEFRDTPAVSIPLSVVPTEKPQRVGSSSLVALFGMVLEVSAGSWRTRGEPASLTKVYKNAINLNVLFPLAQEVAKALNLDPVFVNMPALKRNDISKDIAMKFIVEYFARLSDFDYLTIHCVVVYEVFNIYQKLGPGKGYRARDEKYRVVKGGSGKEPSWFSQADGSAIYYSLNEHERSEILKTTNNAPPKMFVGRALLEVVIPKADTIQKVAKVIQLVQGVGSDNMGPFMLYGMKDFTGMHTHNGRRIMLLTSLAAGELKNGHPVDIHVTTSGDVPPLAYSMQHVIKYLDLNWTCETGYFRIILTPTDYRKVSDCKEHAQAEPRQDEVVICGELRSKTPVTQIHFIDTGLPSSEEKSKPVNWESRAVDYLFMKKPRWIYVGPIFGHYMFGLSPPQSTSTVEIPSPPHKRAWAYCFGDGSTTRGVLADHEISFYGLEYGGKGETDFSLVEIDVKSVTDPESWYRYVRNENGQKLSSWLSPVTRYSPISNLFRQSRRGAMQAFQEQLYEEGGLTKEQIVSLMSIGAEDNVEGEVFQGGLSPASFAQTNSQVPLADTRSDPTASSANSISDMNPDDDGDSGGEVFQ